MSFTDTFFILKPGCHQMKAFGTDPMPVQWERKSESPSDTPSENWLLNSPLSLYFRTKGHWRIGWKHRVFTAYVKLVWGRSDVCMLLYFILAQKRVRILTSAVRFHLNNSLNSKQAFSPTSSVTSNLMCLVTATLRACWLGECGRDYGVQI